MKASGFFLIALGLISLISNMGVSSFSFRNMGMSGIILLLIGINSTLIAIKPNKVFFITIAVLVAILIISIILNMHIYMHRLSMFEWIAISCSLFVGIGLTIRGFIKKD